MTRMDPAIISIGSNWCKSALGVFMFAWDLGHAQAWVLWYLYCNFNYLCWPSWEKQTNGTSVSNHRIYCNLILERMLSRANRSQDRQDLLEKGLTYSHLEMTLVQDNRVFWATGFTISCLALRPVALLSFHTLQN